MKGMTRDQQRKTLVEGLAVGCAALGVEAVTAKKSSVEFALAHAARTWSLTPRFSALTGHGADQYL